MEVLLIIDVQNDFLPGGSLAVKEGDQIVPIINRLMPQFTHIVATQDWHPSQHSSFAANHEGRQIGDIIDIGGFQQHLWPIHCIRDSKGADFAPDLETQHIHKIFYKGTDPAIDSYSGFFDNQRERATGLGDYLKEIGAETVYVAGLATDYCVKYSALDARDLGFTCYLVEDACRGVNLSPEDSQKAIEEMKTQGVVLTHSQDLL